MIIPSIDSSFRYGSQVSARVFQSWNDMSSDHFMKGLSIFVILQILDISGAMSSIVLTSVEITPPVFGSRRDDIVPPVTIRTMFGSTASPLVFSTASPLVFSTASPLVFSIWASRISFSRIPMLYPLISFNRIISGSCDSKIWPSKGFVFVWSFTSSPGFRFSVLIGDLGWESIKRFRDYFFMAETAFPVKIGLEVHGYLDTREKLFCMCRTDSLSSDANSNVCPICTGTPGSKPMGVNDEAVRKSLQIALLFGSKINYENLIWQRKHYNWADNPKGYQTTISGAHARTNAVGGKFHGINITELHLEEDPAQWNPSTGAVDYNRSGLPLIEIVTEPEFSSSEQVVEWLKSLLLSLSYIKAVRKNAGIKVDVNVSTYGERVEMKNLNSLEKIRKAIEYEIARQIEAHERGEVQERETLAFDEKLGKTIKMRSKEGAADYRFIPDPDLPVLKVDEGLVKKLKAEMPEMPEVKLDRLLKKYKVSPEDAKILTKNLELVEFFEALVEAGAVKGLPWVTVELLRVLNYNKKSLEDADVEISPEHLAELIKAVEDGEITKLKGKQIMNDFVPKSFSLVDHKEEVTSISEEAVENLCRQVIDENSHVVDEYKGGKAASLNFLIGQVMRLSERRADFKQVTEKMKGLIGD
jgi:aspartyl-tRNA(Asn)/glutamyl-tRNA(Gln) amidotransferase subunit B